MAKEIVSVRETSPNSLNAMGRGRSESRIGNETIKWSNDGRSSSIKYDRYSDDEYNAAGVRFVHTDVYKSDSDGNPKVYEVMRDTAENRRWVDSFYGSRSGDTMNNDTAMYDTKKHTYVNLKWKP